MDREKWHQKYIRTLMEQGGLSYGGAVDCLSAGMGDYDYNDDPEDAALTEISYWSDDG